MGWRRWWIDDAAIRDHGKRGQAVVFDLLVREDMGDGATADRKCVGNEGTMAAPVKGLGAHDGGPGLSRERAQLVEAASELLGLHIISEGTEACIAPAAVERSLTGTFPEPAQPRKMDVSERSLGELDLQRLAVELRGVPRAWNGPDIGEAVYLEGVEKADELFKAAGRVSDGVQMSIARFHRQAVPYRVTSQAPDSRCAVILGRQGSAERGVIRDALPGSSLPNTVS